MFFHWWSWSKLQQSEHGKIQKKGSQLFINVSTMGQSWDTIKDFIVVPRVQWMFENKSLKIYENSFI